MRVMGRSVYLTNAEANYLLDLLLTFHLGNEHDDGLDLDALSAKLMAASKSPFYHI